MGNSVVKCCTAGGEGVVRVMTAGGEVEEFERPIPAQEIIDRHPGYLVLDATRLEGRDNKQAGQVVPDGITFVAADMVLQPGRLYVLCTTLSTALTTPEEPEKSVLPHVPAALPHRPVPPDDRQTVPSEPDVKKAVPLSELDLSRSHTSVFSNKGSLENSPGCPSRTSIDQFEDFTPTFTRRRSSVVIASDILHAFKVKEEAAVDVPVVPEPKEPRGHGWSTSLSSIPESPATSLRALELPAAAAPATTKTQGSKTPPRNSTKLNELVKQAILHKHPRRFWR